MILHYRSILFCIKKYPKKAWKGLICIRLSYSSVLFCRKERRKKEFERLVIYKTTL